MAADCIAVVVIGRNEEQRLARCLSSLGASNLIYVDSGSTDRSVEIAEQFGAHVVRLDPTSPFSAAGVDGDCELDANWLGEAVAFPEGHPNIVAVCGRRRGLFPDENSIQQVVRRRMAYSSRPGNRDGRRFSGAS